MQQPSEPKPMTDEDRALIREFRSVVNMTPSALKKWLATKSSKEVGWPPDHGSSESVGHRSGRRIVEIKAKRAAEITSEDVAHMRSVVGYVHRHMAQRPSGDIRHTRWRYSLMNWGHDPMRSDGR
jgi:hypothetical protein